MSCAPTTTKEVKSELLPKLVAKISERSFRTEGPACTLPHLTVSSPRSETGPFQAVMWNRGFMRPLRYWGALLDADLVNGHRLLQVLSRYPAELCGAEARGEGWTRFLQLRKEPDRTGRPVSPRQGARDAGPAGARVLLLCRKMQHHPTRPRLHHG